MSRVKAFFFSGRLKRMTWTALFSAYRSMMTGSLIFISSGKDGTGCGKAIGAFNDTVFQCRRFGQKIFSSEAAERDAALACPVRGLGQTTLGKIAAGKCKTEKALIGRRARQSLGGSALGKTREQPTWPMKSQSR